ncbi:transmembrane protein 145-like [Toxorhynchites rutilus septentrionalis]|uniref:transmembrane protein 145-like n=1 Tax=Toxorhynchites rutilus septentrionalis TaxID=329112 RepID=UPI00247A00F2|nr:transmembrane protein 145-like [Toxorhynchites rutilus septentrionalis]XP_055627121.1 transmembrane protein 145-like [Toxorhynchites rutilus septentrionalis]
MRTLTLLSLLWLSKGIVAKYVEGHLKTSADWAFLARFCFLSNHGRYQYEIEYEKRYGELKLLLYYDDKTQWPAVYKTDNPLTCNEKLSVLSVVDNQIVPLSPRNHVYSGCTLLTQGSKDGGSVVKRPAPPDGSTGRTSPKEDDDGFTYDHFLKTSTTETSAATESYEFNITEIDFSTVETNGSTVDGGGVVIQTINSLENGTDYKVFVEELFQDFEEGMNKTRIRRSAKFENKLIVSCSNHGTFTSSRQRWWYIAISNCGSNKGLDVWYRFKMTNGAPGDFWNEHFSADEIYIPPLLLVESIAYTLLLLAVFLCAVELKTRHLYHCTYRLFALSVLLQWFGFLLLSVTWAKYAISGIGPFTTFGGFFTSASEITFLLLLLLMAKGYTITRARLKTCATVKITVFTNLYVIVYISLYLYQLEAFDPGEVLNLYESPAGFGLAGLRCVSWCFFIYSCAATIRKFTEKGPFYYPFSLLGSIWIMSGPILTVVGVNVLDPWVRESVMHGALGLVAFCGHSVFLWLTWPSRANKSFPYHVRTNHVGISTIDDGANYPRHTYEPAPPDAGIIIPLSGNTATLNGIYDQYLRERDVYNSTSSPVSYVSFPASAKSVNQPNHYPNNHSFARQRPAISGDSTAIEDNQRTIYSPPDSAPQSLAINHNTHGNRSYNGNDGNNNYGNDTLVDSGHPSLDISISASPPKVDSTESLNNSSGSVDKITRPSSGTDSIVPSAPPLPEDHRGNSPKVEPKPFNPFIVGASFAAAAEERRKLSKKIILPSLEGQHTEGTVPKHLFAAKREERAS